MLLACFTPHSPATWHKQWLCFLKLVLICAYLSAQISCRQWKTCHREGKTSKQRQLSCKQKPRSCTCCCSPLKSGAKETLHRDHALHHITSEITAHSGQLLLVIPCLLRPTGVSSNGKHEIEIHTPKAASAEWWQLLSQPCSQQQWHEVVCWVFLL